jgi:hypothetical protein
MLLFVLFVALHTAPANAAQKTRLLLHLPATGARITVDEEQKTSHAATRNVKLELPRGHHSIHVELQGYESLDTEIVLGKEDREVTLKLEESLPAAAPVATPAPAPVAPPPAAAPPPPPPEPAAPPAPRTLRVAVLDVPTADGVDDRLAGALSAALLSEVQKRQDVSALGQEPLYYRLSSVVREKLRACADDACVAALGTSLNVDEVLLSRVSRTADSRLVSIRRVAVGGGVRESDTRTAPVGQEQNLLTQIGSAVDALYVDHPSLEPHREVTRAALAAFRPAPPLPPGLFGATVGLGAVFAITGAVFAGLSNTNAQNYQSIANRSETQPVSASQLAGFESQSITQAHTANALFIVGGVLGVGALAEIAFTNWSGKPSAESRAAISLTPGGLQVSWR